MPRNSILLMVICAGLSGCATRGLRRDLGRMGREDYEIVLPHHTEPMAGVYAGRVVRNGRRYHRALVPGILKGDSERTLALMLPERSEWQRDPIPAVFYGEEDDRATERGTPLLVFPRRTYSKHLGDRRALSVPLSHGLRPHQLSQLQQQFPVLKSVAEECPLLVYIDRDIGPDVTFRFRYYIATGGQTHLCPDAMTTEGRIKIVAGTDAGRSRRKYLYLVTVPFDVVTFPLQLAGHGLGLLLWPFAMSAAWN